MGAKILGMIGGTGVLASIVTPAQQPVSMACRYQGSEVPPSRRRSEEHTSELQSRQYLVCRLLLEKKKTVADANPWCYKHLALRRRIAPKLPDKGLSSSRSILMRFRATGPCGQSAEFHCPRHRGGR